MWEEVYQYLSSNIESSLLSIVASGLIGVGIAVYFKKRDKAKQNVEDTKTIKIIDEYTKKAKQIYADVNQLSEKIPESTESQLRKINSLLERNSDELKRIHDTIFDYKLKINTLKEKDALKIDGVLSHIDWLSTKYFKPQLDKEARKPYFLDYRDELSVRCSELYDLK